MWWERVWLSHLTSLHVVCGSVDLVLSLPPACQGTASHHTVRELLPATSTSQPGQAGQHDTLGPFPSVIFTLAHCHTLPPISPTGICILQQTTGLGWSTFLFHLARHHQSNKEIINQEFREMENPALTQPDQDIWVIPAVGPCQCQGFYLLSA